MDVLPQQHNVPLQDIAQALTSSLPRDGSAAMTGDLPMGGRKVTGLGAATAPGDAVRLDQLPATSGWISSVAALTMAADRIPYATGVTTAALAVFTAAGRAIVGAADAAAQRVALGLGTLATKNKAAVRDIDATGTASSATYLRGDGSWQDFSAATKAAIAAASVSEVGSFGFLCGTSSAGVTWGPGTIVSGADLRWTNRTGDRSSSIPPGNWVCLGYSTNADRGTLFKRVS